MLKDKELTCRDCSARFLFTASEQRFFAEKGFNNEPSRCPDCRLARRQDIFSGHGVRPVRDMHPVTCSACGIHTQVPFRPNGLRPVYCKTCFGR